MVGVLTLLAVAGVVVNSLIRASYYRHEERLREKGDGV